MLRTYAIGDIHGCLNKLQDLVKQCRLDAGKQPAKFVFLGVAPSDISTEPIYAKPAVCQTDFARIAIQPLPVLL